MPMYEAVCEVCGVVEELFPRPLPSEQTAIECPECGSEARRIMSQTEVIGITHSKPFVAGKTGEVFETNAQARQYFKENPGARVREWDSAWGRNYKEKYQWKADQKAQKLGFKDARHRSQELKKQRDASPKSPPQAKPAAQPQATVQK